MAAPWFKIYPRQFLTDSKVKVLSREHRSILMDLWCYCSEDGSIPADPETLSRLIGEPPATMRKAMPCLLPFFVERDGRLVSERMEAESLAYEEKCQKLRSSGSKGGLQKVANATANASEEPKQMLLQKVREEGSLKLEKALPPTPLPAAAGKINRTPKVKTLGGYPEELDQAMEAWRGLRRSLLAEETLCRFPNDPDGRYVAQVGTKGKAWEAWQKRRGITTLEGTMITDAHILGAVRLWAAVKLRNATTGKTLSMPNLSSLINSGDFEDALLRVAAPEVSHVG